jgi:hypothetical protein
MRNDGERACSLAGYPTLTAFGCRYTSKEAGCARGQVAQLQVTVRPGDVFGTKDPGDHPVELLRHSSARFRIGTSAAGAPFPWVLITRLLVTLPGLHGSLSVATHFIDGVHKHGRYLLVTTALST